MNYQSIYDNLPIFAQNFACYLKGLKLKKERFDHNFHSHLEHFIEIGNLNISEKIEYRDRQIRGFIAHAYNTVPYYKRLFDDLRLSISDFNAFEDLKKLPILTKQDVLRAGKDMLSTKFDYNKLLKDNTSGSTGSALELFYTQKAISMQWALWWRYRLNLGINLDEWSADFGSKTIVPIKQSKPPFWRISKPLKQVRFSAFHGNPNTFLSYYEEIKKRNLRWIHGYPSVITPFADFLNKNNLSLKGTVKYVTTGGENLYPFQRKIMFDAFGVMPYSHYGLSEMNANISENINHELVVDEDFAAVEFIQEGDLFKIVGTNYSNYAMPLIRYETNDLASINLENFASFPRKIDYIDGRSGDFIFLKTGEKMGALSALFTDSKHIIEAQIYQKKDFSVQLRYVSNSSTDKTNEDLALVKEKIRQRLGDNLEYTFVKVNQVERTKNGKVRYVINEIEPNHSFN